MAVSVPVIKTELLSALNEASASELSNDDWAGLMADIIANAILSATVNPGISLTTPDTINGATTGAGTLS